MKNPLEPFSRRTVGNRIATSLLCLLMASSLEAAPTPSDPTSRESDPAPPCLEQIDRVRRSVDHLDELAARLAAARCILVERCAAPLTKVLYADALKPSESSSSGSASADVAEALRYLVEAEAALPGPALSELDEEVRHELETCIEQLRAFAEMFAALLETSPESSAEQHRSRLIEACAGLSQFLDDPRGGVVDASRLWQGAAYRRAGRPDRALQVLRPVLAAPRASRLGLMARLERCRALADRGEYAAALALAGRVARRVEGWFEKESAPVRQQAVDAVRFVRVELYRMWAEKLRADGQEGRAEDADEAAARHLGDDTWPVDAGRRLALHESISDLPVCESRMSVSAPDDTAEEAGRDRDAKEEIREEKSSPQTTRPADRDTSKPDTP